MGLVSTTMLDTDGQSPPEEPLIPSGPFGVAMAPWALPVMPWDEPILRPYILNPYPLPLPSILFPSQDAHCSGLHVTGLTVP